MLPAVLVMFPLLVLAVLGSREKCVILDAKGKKFGREVGHEREPHTT